MLVFAIAVVVWIGDQLSKTLIVSMIGPAEPEQRIDIVGSWIALEYAENRGAAFGLLAGLGPLLTVGSIIVIGALLFHQWRTVDPPLWETVATGAIVGGAVGNLADRVRLGYVIDFVSVGSWPNFNVADSAITLGVAVAIWSWLYYRAEQSAALTR